MMSGQRPDRMRVIVGGSYWTLNGVNVFSENLVRGLSAMGWDAEILLTEEDSDLISINDAAMPRRADLQMRALPVARWASWGGHWGAMLRYLEDRAPCVYIPNSDWRHSCVCPLLSDGVRVVGVVHSDDPLHYDHVHRIGAYWDAVVTTSPVIARKTLERDPDLRDRTEVIPIGVAVPPAPPERTFTPGEPLRVIYPGTLKQHQKRVLDLPKIVEAAARRNLPFTLTIAGGGPDECQLRDACADLVAQGRIQFLGVVQHDALLSLLESHDVFILTSEFEGLPNALLEAMGRGCVPLVTDIESGIPEVVHEGVSGYLVPVGDIDAFVDRLERLGRDVEQRRTMSLAAYAAVVSGRFRVEDMVESYAHLCERLTSPTATFVRPRGELSHPPADIGGVSLFPVALDYTLPGVGAFPERLPDSRQFLAEVSAMKHPERSPLWSLVQGNEADRRSLDGVKVIVGAPAWTECGLNAFSESLVRGLVQAGVDARIVLTEADTDLVEPGPAIPLPEDLVVDRLLVTRTDGWGAHWGAMVRYLEDRAPCIYLPTFDWRHSVVAPLLSDDVAIVGTVAGPDPLHEDHARRLGVFWNAVITADAASARTLSNDPALAPRVFAVPNAGPDVALDYLDIFRDVITDVRSGAFRRPAGSFAPPPHTVADVDIFATDVSIMAGGEGTVPPVSRLQTLRADREFRAQVRLLKHPGRSPLGPMVRQAEIAFNRLQGMEVIVGLPDWQPGGIEQWSATLVRELTRRGVSAHLLLTETDTILIQRRPAAGPPPADVPVVRLPIDHSAGWGAHWGCMTRYLEDHAPCIYIPNHDWRHSCVAPLLSDRVVIVGVVHGDDAMQVDHAHRLGRYWNACVTYNDDVARLLAGDQDVAHRLHLLPFETDDVALDYLDVFNAALAGVEAGQFRRPVIVPQLRWTSPDDPDGTGLLSDPRDHRPFLAEIAGMTNAEQSPLWPLVQQERTALDRLKGVDVIVGLPDWQPGGIEEWSATLVRELTRRGISAHLLLTETDTALIRRPSAAGPPPDDVPVARLPVDHSAGWGAHWDCMTRYLEDHAPCIYIPNHDWRHSCVAPVLSDRVMIVGVVHGDDALHLDHAQRLGRFWNACVTYNDDVARLLAGDADLANRLHLLPFETGDVARDHMAVFAAALADAEAGRFSRPHGTLLPPPQLI